MTAGVYKGFSVGGRALDRDPKNRKIITKMALTEISLVDRPANPEAVFDCWKAAGGTERARDPEDHPDADVMALIKAARAEALLGSAAERFVLFKRKD